MLFYNECVSRILNQLKWITVTVLRGIGSTFYDTMVSRTSVLSKNEDGFPLAKLRRSQCEPCLRSCSNSNILDNTQLPTFGRNINLTYHQSAHLQFSGQDTLGRISRIGIVD